MTTPNTTAIPAPRSITTAEWREERANKMRLQERQRLFRQVEAVRSILQRTDRIVTGRGSLSVSISQHGPNAVSWTDGQDVFLSKARMEADLADPRLDMAKFVVRWKGANYHEVAHIMLTPRMVDPLVVWLKRNIKTDNDQRWWWAYNALEDQRIETQYTALYSPTIPYFTQTCMHFLLHDTSALPRVYPLIHGRKFLGKKLRRAVRDPFVTVYGQQLADDFAAVIDEYLPLVLPRDTTKAQKLIRLYYDLLTSSTYGTTLPEQGCGEANGGKYPGEEGTNAPHKGKPRTAEQSRASKKVQENADDTDLDTPDEDEDENENPYDEEGEGDGDGDTEGDGDDGEGESSTDNDGQGTGSGEVHPVKDHQHQEEELPEGEQAVERNTERPKVDSGDLADAIKRAQEQAEAEISKTESDPLMAQDVQDTCRSIRSAAKGEGNTSTENYGHNRLEEADATSLKLARDIEQIVRRIQLDLEPSWLRGEPVGRVNMDRYFLHKADPGMTDIFDQWDEGAEDESGVETVILIDLSYSMYGQIVGASRALWAIKRAFDDVNIRTTVIGFSDNHVIMYRPTDKAPKGKTPLFSVISATVPNSALREAYNILSRSEEPNKLMFAITDGAWQGDAEEQNTIIQALRKMGVVTSLFAIGHNTLTWGGDHGMDIAATVEKIEELPKLVLATVTALLKNVQLH